MVSPEIISKNLAALKANKVSQKESEILVLGADSVIDLNGELISKPENREEAMNILKKLTLKLMKMRMFFYLALQDAVSHLC